MSSHVSASLIVSKDNGESAGCILCPEKLLDSLFKKLDAADTYSITEKMFQGMVEECVVLKHDNGNNPHVGRCFLHNEGQSGAINFISCRRLMKLQIRTIWPKCQVKMKTKAMIKIWSVPNNSQTKEKALILTSSLLGWYFNLLLFTTVLVV